MVSDLEQMENIVTQFLAYARRNKSEQVEVDLGEAVKAAMDNARLKSDSTIETEVSLETGHLVMAHPIELSRAIQNLFTNASRYGRSEDGRSSCARSGRTPNSSWRIRGRAFPKISANA